MASLVSKRQQAKNEKVLQQLISTVPGNERCADCATPNPGWASWNLGIFLCMRCAALHRKLGTHISKVKSLSMDSWNADQVDTMKRVGNEASNRTFNPQDAKPSIPMDIDEVDGAMERFIRQKYEHRAYVSGSKAMRGDRTGSVSSDDRPPPPLPPKPGRKFGFGLRSASSLVSRSDKLTPPISPVMGSSNSFSSPAKTNKQSRVLGSTVGNQEDDFDAKLATLRDMGFRDTRRNSTILKSMNGNLDRTVETLVRIGESNGPPSGNITPVSTSSGANGITVTKRRPSENPTGDPFDALDYQPLPQRSATMPIQHSLPPSQPLQNVASTYQQYQQPQSNPFALQQSFQSLQLSQPVQNAAGRMNNNGTNPFLPPPPATSLSYPLPTSPSQYQSPTQTPLSSNPFERAKQHQNTNLSDPWTPQAHPSFENPATNAWASQHNQFVQSPQGQVSTGYAQNQNQTDFFSQPGQQYQPQFSQAPSNPFVSETPRTMTPSNPFQQPLAMPSAPQINHPGPFQVYSQALGQQQQQYSAQATTPQSPYSMPTQQSAPLRHDKSSIMALYGQSYLPPSQPLQSPTGEQPMGPPQRSFTMPVTPSSGTMNPFATQLNTQAEPGANANGSAGYGYPAQMGSTPTTRLASDTFGGAANHW